MGRFVELVNFAPLQRGYDLPNSKLKDGKYPVVYSNGIRNYHNEFKAISPGVITGRSGTIGKVTYIESGEYWPHNTSLWVTDFKENCPKFVYYTLQNINFSKYSSGSGVPTLNRNDIHHEIVYCPPIEEQQAIAETLQTWDTAIEKTEKLIAEKERQFEEVQNSLMDKNFKAYNFHLSEYAGILKQQKIDQVGSLKPLTVKLHCKGIKRNERDFQITLSKKGRPYFQRFAGEFLIGRQNFHNGGFGIVPSELDGFIASNAITTLKIDQSKLDARYLFYFLSRKDYYLRISHVMDGTGQKELSDKQIMQLPVSIPDLESQKAVVNLLDVAQKEVNLLKQQAEQYRMQKRGLMQKLLTGEWRSRI